MSLELQISMTKGGQDIDPLIDGMVRPAWFKEKLKPVLAKHLEEHEAQVFTAKNGKGIEGTAVLWTEPPHFSHGKKVPVFGWVECETKSTFKRLMNAVELHAKSTGCEKIRGPINLPNFFGGWGVMRSGFERPLLVDSAWNRPELSSWYESLGYNRVTDYVSVEVTEPLHVEPPFPNMRCESYPIKDLLSNETFMAKLGAFVKENFSSFLPDTSPATHMMEIFDILAQVDHGEDFYVLVFDDSHRGRLAAAMLQVPNIFDIWSGKPLESANINTVIVAKDYRGHDFFHWVFTQLVKKLRKRGVTTQVGGAIWSRNKQGMYTFLRVSKQVADFCVYEKKI